MNQTQESIIHNFYYSRTIKSRY